MKDIVGSQRHSLKADTNGCANCIATSHPHQCGPTGWLAMLLINAGDVESIPCSTTTHKQNLGSRLNTVCTKDAQVYTKNNIQIPGPTIYTENPYSQRIHTDIAPHYPPDPGPSSLSTPHLHHPHYRNPNTDKFPTLEPPNQTHTYTSHTIYLLLSSRALHASLARQLR